MLQLIGWTAVIIISGPRSVNQIIKILWSFDNVLVLNTGTLSSDSVKPMILAGKKANELNIPVILNPVGVGATRLKSKSIEDILCNVKIAVIKGNMSEIKFISGLEVSIRGVDSIADSHKSEKAVRELASKLGCIVVITSKQDIVSDGNEVFYVSNGREMVFNSLKCNKVSEGCPRIIPFYLKLYPI